MRTATIALLIATANAAWAAETVRIHTTDGRLIEGVAANLAALRATVNGQVRKIPLAGLLSFHNGAAASASEAKRIADGIAAIQAYKNETIQSPERRSRDAAVEDLTNIGLPVLTPLLNAFKDTDQHEPKPLYRLFERLIPGEADQLDRTAAYFRLASGQLLRGAVEPFTVSVNGQAVSSGDIRLLAVRRKSVSRNFELHSLRHSTQIEYLDTGVILSASTTVATRAYGFVRLSWATDGWASDADGLKVPGPNYKTNLVDGHPFGAVVARVGAAGEVIKTGANMAARKGLAPGRLHMAVNDNRHWQNNLGAFRVTLQATAAYDVGTPQ